MEQIEFRSMIGGIPKYAAVMLTITVCASVVYEYFYFRLLGFEFLSVYTASDFLKISIYWIPTVAIGSAVGVSISYLDTRSRSAAYLENRELANKIYRRPDQLMKWAIRTMIFLFVVSIPSLSLINLTPIFLIAIFINGYVMRKLISMGRIPITNRPLEEFATYVFISGIILVSATQSISRAALDMRKTEPLYTIKSSNFDGKAVILKMLEKGIIYKPSGTKRVNFTPWDDVKLIESPDIELDTRPIYKILNEAIFKY